MGRDIFTYLVFIILYNKEALRDAHNVQWKVAGGKYMQGDTIAAIGSAMSASGIGIVRISGDDARAILKKVYRTKATNKNIAKEFSHTIHYGFIYDGEKMIDEVLVMLMNRPKSYTGEDTVEINCHGGVLSMRKVLEVVIKNGARIAEPGEFTKRAFLNGKIDLSQAEAVGDIINAKSEYALQASVSQLSGNVQRSIREIREKVLYNIAYIESALDDPEHISIDGYGEELEKVVVVQKNKLEKLIASADEGRMIKEGIKTVIIGKPNAGKSSLLNILLGEERAIVTDVAGTTRDVLEEMIVLDGVSLRMMDTAGIRETSDIVEKIGVKKTREQAQKADLILYVVDSSIPLDENDEKIFSMLRKDGKRAIVLLNKTDLKAVVSESELQEKCSFAIIPISAKEESGIEELEKQMKEMFFKGKISFNDEVYITNMRHKEALMEAHKSLEMVETSINDGMPEDFYSIDLMNAYQALGRITGETASEDLVNEIFSKFCTGK